MRTFNFAILFILVSTDCLISLTMGSNTTDRNILIRIIDKSRNARCSPKVIKPIMKRIAPAWSLKDLYETDYRTAAKAQSDKSVEPLTGYKQLTSRKIEMLLYTPYTQLTTTESTMETFSEETSTQSMKRPTMKPTKGTEMKYQFFFLTTTRGTNNYHQKKPRTHKKIPLKTTQNIKAQDDKEISFEFLSKSDREFDDVNQTNYKINKAIEQLNNKERGFFPNPIKNNSNNSPLPVSHNKTGNLITTTSSTTNSKRINEIYSSKIKNHLKNFQTEYISMQKRYNHQDLTMVTDATSIWKRNKAVKRSPTTPDTDVYTNANNKQNTRQMKRREYYRSGNIAEKLRDVLLYYDISRRPEQTRNSFQKFGLVYVPVPLKLKARYNYLNHYSVNPRMQVMLSNYGYYLPGSLGIKRFGLYNHLAYNNIYVNKPFGATYRNIIEPDSENWYDDDIA